MCISLGILNLYGIPIFIFLCKKADEICIQSCYTGIVEREELLHRRDFLFFRRQYGTLPVPVTQMSKIADDF